MFEFYDEGTVAWEVTHKKTNVDDQGPTARGKRAGGTWGHMRRTGERILK